MVCISTHTSLKSCVQGTFLTYSTSLAPAQHQHTVCENGTFLCVVVKKIEEQKCFWWHHLLCFLWFEPIMCRQWAEIVVAAIAIFPSKGYVLPFSHILMLGWWWRWWIWSLNNCFYYPLMVLFCKILGGMNEGTVKVMMSMRWSSGFPVCA